jgi:hypothetical protein
MTRKSNRRRAGLVTLLLAVSAMVACDGHYHGPTAPSGSWDGLVGSGNVVQEDRPVNGVRGVLLSTVGTVFIEQGGFEALVVVAEENLLPLIMTEVQGGTLRIWSDQPFHNTQPIQFHLTVSTLRSAELGGAGEIVGSNLNLNRLLLELTGAGGMDFSNLRADELEVMIAGAGGVHVSGEVWRQRVTISGAGGYEGHDLQSAEAEVDILGAGSATVRVSDRLDVTISGTGSVRYIGDPSVNSTVLGTGTVIRIGG